MREAFARYGVTSLALAVVLVVGCRRAPRIDSNIRIPADASRPYGSVGPAGYSELQPQPFDLTAIQEFPLAQALPARTGTIEPVALRWAEVKVYFAYDSAALGPSERPKLETLSQHLMEHPQYSVVVEGHCDERGSDEYNRALGECRALVVRDYLITLGVAAARVETISYGEERPDIPDAVGEQQHRENRRAEFVIGIKK